jgi:hypothetical protein
MKYPSGNLTNSDSKSKTIKPKHLSSNRKGLLGKVLVVGLILAGVTAVPQLENSDNDARANGSSDKVGLYLSAPMVMGSGVTEAVLRANFDTLATGPCPASLAGIGTLTLSAANACSVDPAGIYGGASTDTAVRTFGGTGTRYMAVPFYNSGSERSMTFNLASAAKYVGFYWSGGNNGNLVRFFDDEDNLIAEVESKDVSDLLGGELPGYLESQQPTGSVNRIDGLGQYSQTNYRGNPVFYSDLNTKFPDTDPTDFKRNSNQFVFTYLNLFVEGSLNITKVQFAGPGFEFDNLAFSTVQQTPEDTMVKVLEKTSPSLTWSPTTALLLAASPATPSQLATKSGDGVISYAVKNAGATGCTVNSSTGVITYTALGSCVVTATVTGTSTYLKSTKDVTFTISATAPPSNNQGSGSSSSTALPPVTTQSSPAAPCTISPSSATNSATKSKTFSGFAINSARLTPPMKKQIRTWLNRHPERVCVSVAGFTMGPRVLPTDPKLAKDRARSVRAYITSIRPEASFTPITSRTQRLVGDDVRRAKVTLRF